MYDHTEKLKACKVTLFLMATVTPVADRVKSDTNKVVRNKRNV